MYQLVERPWLMVSPAGLPLGNVLQVGRSWLTLQVGFTGSRRMYAALTAPGVEWLGYACLAALFADSERHAANYGWLNCKSGLTGSRRVLLVGRLAIVLTDILRIRRSAVERPCTNGKPSLRIQRCCRQTLFTLSGNIALSVLFHFPPKISIIFAT